MSRFLLQITTLALSVSIVNGKWLKSFVEPTWELPRVTQGATDVVGFSPKPTTAPGEESVLAELRPRAGTQTCAYLAGYSSSAIITCNGVSTCATDSKAHLMGCCPPTGVCNLATTCYDYTQSSLAKSANGAYVWCSNAGLPRCVSVIFDNKDPSYSGYTNHDYCMASATTLDVFFRATDAAAASKSGGSSLPIAAIVGGAVGGVVLIVLVTVGICCLVRRNKRKAKYSAVPNLAAGGNAGTPLYPIGAPKPPYQSNVYTSPVQNAPYNSPPAQGFGYQPPPGAPYGAPPPAQGPGFYPSQNPSYNQPAAQGPTFHSSPTPPGQYYPPHN